VFLAMWLLALLAKVVLLFTGLPEFWIPLAAVPLWVSTGYDRRVAFLVTVVLSFIVASFLRFDLLLLTTMLSQGMAATLLYLDRKHMRHMVMAGALAGLSTAALLVAVRVTLEGHFHLGDDLDSLTGSRVVACIGGGVFAGLIAALLRSPVLRLLGHVPRERLLDLTDLEQPLLQKMSREAPGSWEHSRAMANLAEAAASAIGADALLTRVGAYYHDLGKTTQAKYFVENLGPDEKSPHTELEPEVSADAIMAHVVVGTKILRDGGIPEPVVEFAYTHHGTQLVEYFYNKCLEQGNPKNLSADAFRYPGMKPATKETAILMLVDSIEAASRTIDPPEREAFETMIQRIIFTKLRSGQLDDSGLTVEDLRTLVNRMTDTLVNMHHHRVKYQWQAHQAEQFGVPAHAARVNEPESPAPPARASAPEIRVKESVLPASLPPEAAPGTAPEGTDEG
jgi:putative nucleotidyltransferase with HDIG domain